MNEARKAGQAWREAAGAALAGVDERRPQALKACCRLPAGQLALRSISTSIWHCLQRAARTLQAGSSSPRAPARSALALRASQLLHPQQHRTQHPSDGAPVRPLRQQQGGAKTPKNGRAAVPRVLLRRAGGRGARDHHRRAPVQARRARGGRCQRRQGLDRPRPHAHPAQRAAQVRAQCGAWLEQRCRRAGGQSALHGSVAWPGRARTTAHQTPSSSPSTTNPPPCCAATASTCCCCPSTRGSAGTETTRWTRSSATRRRTRWARLDRRACLGVLLGRLVLATAACRPPIHARPPPPAPPRRSRCTCAPTKTCTAGAWTRSWPRWALAPTAPFAASSGGR